MQQRLDVEVTTRGRQRLETCAFPPLRLDFRRSQVTGTLFAGQNRLKLVTRCRDTRRSEEYLELEYFAYRAYEQVGAAAFRVRPSRMRYVDLERDNDVSVAGFDGVATPWLDLELTTVVQPLAEKGRATARAVLSRIAGEVVDDVLLPVRMRVSGSTGPAPHEV